MLDLFPSQSFVCGLVWTARQPRHSSHKLRGAFVHVAGMVLNCFAFRVWSSRTMRGTSLAVYLRALSLSDMGALIFTYFLGYWRSHHAAFNTLFLVRYPCAPARHSKLQLLLICFIALGPKAIPLTASVSSPAEPRVRVPRAQDPGVHVPDDVAVAADGADRGASARGVAAAARTQPGLPASGREGGQADGGRRLRHPHPGRAHQVALLG